METSRGGSLTKSKPVVWLTGANGLLGNYLFQAAMKSAPDFSVRALTRVDFDLLDFAAVEREFLKDKPTIIIHCAAISTAAEAQKNPELAKRVNIDATRLLSELATEVQMIFFSTDLVFDGRKGNYSESDKTNPLHLYGETKVAGEELVLKNPKHLVVRTSINFGQSRSGNRGFNEQFRSSIRQAGQAMKLFTDEFRSPIPAAETARVAWELALKRCAGIFHVAGAEKLSRFRIGELLLEYWKDETVKIQSGSAKNFPGPPRTLDVSLNISKVQNMLSVPLPSLSEWLTNHPNKLS